LLINKKSVRLYVAKFRNSFSEIVYNEWSELSEETSAENSLSGLKKNSIAI